MPASDPRVRVQKDERTPIPKVGLSPQCVPPDVKPIAQRTCAHTNEGTQNITSKNELISHRTRSRQTKSVVPHCAAQRRYPMYFIFDWAMPIIDNVTGETLEHRQLRRHPKYNNISTESYSNELGRLCQGISKGKGTHGPTK